MLDPFLATLRSRRSLLFALAGFGGGAAGALLAEILPDFGRGLVLLTAHVAVWSALFTSVMTLALFWAQEFYSRRERPAGATIWRALRVGALAGALGGGVAQIVFAFGTSETFFGNVVFRSLCWGLMGVLVGWRLAGSVPNLGAARGAAGGGIGGLVGGIGFIIGAILLPETFGRMLGIGLLGLALGLGIVVAERLWREASLEVIWAPKETTTLSLGARPLRIGGGDDHVFIAGLPAHAASLVLDGGKVRYTDTATGRQTDFRDGSRVKIGPVEMVVHARG